MNSTSSPTVRQVSLYLPPLFKSPLLYLRHDESSTFDILILLTVTASPNICPGAVIGRVNPSCTSCTAPLHLLSRRRRDFCVNKHRLRMTQLASGHTVKVLEGEELEHQERDFQGYTNGLIRLNPGRWILLADYTKFADSLFKFKFRESDAVVMTWAKCGTTWMQEIIWTMRNNPNLDHPLASLPLFARSPFLDFDMVMLSKNVPPIDDGNPLLKAFKVKCPGKDPKDGIMLQLAEAIPDPRTIKTHLPLSLLTPDLLDTAKVVYVARSPKDVVVSFHHHSRLIRAHGYTGSLDQFVQYFVDDNLLIGPYWLHMKEAWEKRDHPNMHFVFFEDVKTNTMLELHKLNKFLDTNLTEEQLQKVAHYTSFSEMKSREEKNFVSGSTVNKQVLSSEGGFFRKGVVGDGQKRLSPEQQAKVDQWTKKHTQDFGASFKYSS